MLWYFRTRLLQIAVLQEISIYFFFPFQNSEGTLSALTFCCLLHALSSWGSPQQPVPTQAEISSTATEPPHAQLPPPPSHQGPIEGHPRGPCPLPYPHFHSNLVKQVFTFQHHKNKVLRHLNISHIIHWVNKKLIASRSADKVMPGEVTIWFRSLIHACTTPQTVFASMHELKVLWLMRD